MSCCQPPPAAKKTRRKVSDEEFRLAYYGDKRDPESVRAAENNRNVLEAVLRKYSATIPSDDLQSVGFTAMWRCLQYHDVNHPSHQKLTTSLHRFAEWECLREVRKINRLKRRRVFYHLPLVEGLDCIEEGDFTDELAEDMEHVEARMDMLSWQDRNTIEEYYVDGLTQEQIGRRNHCSKETARNRIDKAVRALRQACQ